MILRLVDVGGHARLRRFWLSQAHQIVGQHSQVAGDLLRPRVVAQVFGGSRSAVSAIMRARTCNQASGSGGLADEVAVPIEDPSQSKTGSEFS